MTSYTTLAILIVCSYFIGSIPFAYVLVKLIKGIDVRTVGSGNAGATNAGRVLGKFGFLAVFLLDFMKGFIPVMVMLSYYGDTPQFYFVWIIGITIVLGHTFSAFLNFKGGKGVATAGGIFCAITPIPALIAFLSFAVVFLATKMVSAGSIFAALALFVAALFTSDVTLTKVMTGIIAFFVIYMHRSNISRILSGTENKIQFKKKV